MPRFVIKGRRKNKTCDSLRDKWKPNENPTNIIFLEPHESKKEIYMSEKEFELNYRANVKDYLGEFLRDLTAQLEEDDRRWGDTWKKRPIEGQEGRTKATFDNYFDQFENGGIPVPWLKVVGNAYICWLREYQKKKDLENETKI